MKRFLTIVSALTLTLLASCSYDDTPLWNKINDHESRILALEELCRETNTNIEALRTLIGAVQNADYITSVTPIKEGSDVVGYTITFAKSEPITIYNGTDGKDGAQGEQGEPSVIVPEIGIKQDADGIYYWTIDGEWLTDDNGNKVPAVAEKGDAGTDGEDGKDGANGKDGKDGVTPQLKIEGDYWYVSYDEGKTWTKLGLATTGNGGTGADSIFSNVEVGTDSVTFTMLDGTKFTVKFYAKPEIIFEGVDEDMAYLEEQEFEIGYTVVGGDDETVVESFASGPYWSAIAVEESATTGKIKIVAGEGDGKVVVIVTTGMGSVTMKSIKFEAGKVVGIEDLYRVDSNAGTLVVEFQTNVNLDDCEVISYDDWLSVAETRAEMRDESLAFNYTANPYDSERWAWVEIYTKEGFYVDSFDVVQDAAEYTGPTLPEDIYPESTSFAHSLLFVMHTGMNSGFSPRMVDNLLALAEQYPQYNDSYNIVECHAGAFTTGDPANSPAANVVNQFYDIPGYPYLFVNFYTDTVGNSKEETFLADVIDVFNNHLDVDGADAGISIATEADADVVYVSAGIKAAVEQEYKVTAWLLENNIYSPNQSGATKDYHLIYNHALRNIAGSYDKTDIQGESIGVIEMGATATTSFELDILSEKWSVENMEVLVIVSALNENNQWEVVNTKVCPINNSVDFYSNGSASGGGDNEEEDEWVALGDGYFFEDFVSWLYGATPGNMATVAIEESATRPGYYRMVNPFCEENMEIFIGGTPEDVTYAEEAYIEIDATDPNRVWIPFQPAGFTINGFGEIWIGYVSEEQGKMEDGNISFPTNALGLFLDGDGAYGYYANTSGLFKVVLPGSTPSDDHKYTVVEVAYAYAQYYGEIYSGFDNYYLGLSNADMVNDGLQVPGAEYYYFDLYAAELTEGNIPTTIPYGIYNTTNYIGEWTIDYNYSCYYKIDAYGGDYEFMKNLDTATVTVREDGIVANFTTEGRDYTVIFNGEVTVENMTNQGGDNEGNDNEGNDNEGNDNEGNDNEGSPVSTLTEDLTFDITNAEYILEYYGDYYENGTDNYILVICEDMKNRIGTYVLLDLVTAASGVFASSFVVNDSLKEYTIFPGYIESNYMYGSWYCNVLNGSIVDQAPLVSGDVMIDVYSEGYKVAINCYDDAGNNIVGTISGTQYNYMVAAQSSKGTSKKSKMVFRR